MTLTLSTGHAVIVWPRGRMEDWQIEAVPERNPWYRLPAESDVDPDATTIARAHAADDETPRL